jgi:16S rRNA processing protein RimM
VRGEVTVVLSTDRVERLTRGAVLYSNERTLVVASARRQRDGWLVRFEGFDDRDAAESLRGTTLFTDSLPDDTPGDALWVHEVVGAEARDTEGNRLGRVAAVEANPAHDLLVLDDGTLVPSVFVVEHGPDGLVVDPPPGLLDVNRP